MLIHDFAFAYHFKTRISMIPAGGGGIGYDGFSVLFKLSGRRFEAF